MQTSTIELLHSYGVGTAPLSNIRQVNPPEDDSGRVVGLIPFHAKGFNGSLLLSLPRDLVGATSSNALGSSHAVMDWGRELVNQLIGRVKNRLGRFQVTLGVGLPTAASPQMAERQLPNGDTRMDFRFRTLRGDVIVALVGEVDPSVLVFTGGADQVTEGDVILF